ncbi:MAG: STAS domain-containing protein [Mariprofundaceae bacterium]|nr:STAS domain-containing protein [Mariprofundaceae bacterium]
MTTKATPKKSAPRRASGAKSKADQAHVIQLKGNLGIAQAESLHEQFCHALANHGEVMMDAGELAQVDASTVQLFRAFIRDAKEGAIPVKWKAVPEELRQTADMMGMVNGISFDG